MNEYKGSTASDASRRRTIWTITGALLALIVLLIVGIVATGGNKNATASNDGGSQESAQQSQPSGPDLSRRTEGDPMAMGDVDAPVVMIEYSDYRCPFCGLFARETLPTLTEKYIETGKVRYEWRDLPVFGEQSFMAASAGRAAAEQGMFWDFNQMVYSVAPERGHADLTADRLLELAKKAGIPDIAEFKADMKSGKYKEAINKDIREAASLGATGTPLFMINGKPIMGAQPLGVFEQTIESALEEAK